MNRSVRFTLTCLIPPLLGCTETPDGGETSSNDTALSDRKEVIHQLREVIRYEDEKELQRRAELESLALPVDVAAPAKTMVPAGQGQSQAQQ